MAQVVDSPRFRIDSDSDEEIDIEIGARSDQTGEAPDEQSTEHDTASLLTTGRRTKRARSAILTVSFLFLVGVSIGLATRFSRQSESLSAETGGEFTVSIGSLATIGGEDVQKGDVVPFLDVQFFSDNTALFILSKALWNSSFIVYPTVVKRAAPVVSGLERGGILLETNDYAFHFEFASTGRYLQLVQEYHYASLHGGDADELQQMFDDSQWPGFVTKVPIYAETDTAYYIPSDSFLSNGFFVSSVLSSSDFTALEEPSESFARNTMLFVEYELPSGVIEVNYAIGLLPDEAMPPRVADDRVGYFSNRYTQYSLTDEEGEGDGYHRWDPQTTVIHRRRLELDSTGNTTKDPITYHIDPSVPMEWRETFAAGVEAWLPAFERSGFPNAIRAVLPDSKDWPSDYRLGDLRYNSISVMISEKTYAYGPSITDPRSGEIVHSDIVFEYGFFNEVMADFDMKSPVTPPKTHGVAANDGSKASTSDKKPKHVHTGDDNGYVPKRLIAQHFADIVMHEVGHTLGLRHNFAGSAAYSRDQLRDPEFVAEHGISTSIMDYLPANIFSDLTKDEAEKHAFYMTTIGAYDYAAIEYGYSVVDDEIPGYKHPRLTELAAAAPLFLTDESVDGMLNPFAQRFDLSSDPVDFAADRLQFVQKTRRANALLDKIPEDASWTALWKRERIQLRLLEQAIKFVRPMLGGVNVTHAHRGKGESSYNATFVPKDTQMKALGLLLRIVKAESGLFPEPKDYGSFVEVIGYEDEDCTEPSLDFGCLGLGLVDVGAYELRVRAKALLSALFPAMDRIVQQDVLSPLSLDELLAAVAKAVSAQPFSIALTDYLTKLFRDVISSDDTDKRIKNGIEAQWGMTEPPVVIVKTDSGDN